MTVQKFIKYTQVDITGKQLSSEQELKLNVLDKSGNYLIHKDFVRHLTTKRQRTAFIVQHAHGKQWSGRHIAERNTQVDAVHHKLDGVIGHIVMRLHY